MKKMFKKLIGLTLAAGLVLSVAACGGGGGDNSGKTSEDVLISSANSATNG